MKQGEIIPYYNRVCDVYEKAYYLCRNSMVQGSYKELGRVRGYIEGSQTNLIEEMGLGKINLESVKALGDEAKEMGLLTEKGVFLLQGRYLIPVEDYLGNIIALIGYNNDEKKYITTPSPLFSKELLFFNFKQAYDLSYAEYGGLVYVVEGIFDCLALRSIGLPCIATMGATISKEKGEQLKVFKKVIAIPDDDKTGKKCLNRYTRQGWKVPNQTTMIDFRGGEVEIGEEKLKIKDVDNMVALYEEESVRDILLSYSESREEVEVLEL